MEAAIHLSGSSMVADGLTVANGFRWLLMVTNEVNTNSGEQTVFIQQMDNHPVDV